MTKRQHLTFVMVGYGLGSVLSASSPAGTIVPGLDDASALRSFTTVNQTVTDTRGTLSHGLTLAVRVTPNATDIRNSFTGPVTLLEIGGTQNGSTLLVLDGQYWFISKSNAGPAAPKGISDYDGIDSAIGVAIGAAIPDQQADVYASLDSVNARLIVSIDGNAAIRTLANVADWNWEGNGTVTFAGNDTVLNGSIYGSRGGLSENELSRFYTNSSAAFTGTVSHGQYFNAVARPVSKGGNSSY